MRIQPGARTAWEGLALLACAALGFQLLISGRVHLFVGTIITTLLWIACPVLTIMGLWTFARAVRHPNTAGHHRNRIGILIVAPVALGMLAFAPDRGHGGGLLRCDCERSGPVDPLHEVVGRQRPQR